MTLTGWSAASLRTMISTGKGAGMLADATIQFACDERGGQRGLTDVEVAER